jgi:hypothetical protein
MVGAILANPEKFHAKAKLFGILFVFCFVFFTRLHIDFSDKRFLRVICCAWRNIWHERRTRAPFSADLLRQRQALRDAGRNPDEADVRPPEIVENYEQ